MIQVQFREPNFRAKVLEKSRPGAKPDSRLLYAEDEAKARAWLENFGFEVLDLKPYDFKNWKKRAATARATALKEYPKARAAGKEYKWASALWGELKEHLQLVVHGRCAYCEALFLSVSFGDVEHYRPKGNVREDSNHPGYYWLAYEPTNYLPSCMRCNQEAKRNYFPVQGVRAYHPEDKLADENPSLINPYVDNYYEHVAFYPSRGKNSVELTAGKAVARSDKGQQSIDTFALNPNWLVRERKKAQVSVRAILKEALVNEDPQRILNILTGCIIGSEEYCTAVATEIDHYYRTMGLSSPFPPEITLEI